MRHSTRDVLKEEELVIDRDEAIDPLFGIKSFNDSRFVLGCKNKWGTNEAYMKPNIKKVPKIDSHTTLSKNDQRRVNNILYRNAEVYYNYAKNEIESRLARSAKLKSRKSNTRRLINTRSDAFGERSEVEQPKIYSGTLFMPDDCCDNNRTSQITSPVNSSTHFERTNHNIKSSTMTI